MKPQRFKPGQEIVCIKKGSWVGTFARTYFGFFRTNKKVQAPGPEFNEIVTCDGYDCDGYVLLVEYNINAPNPNGPRSAYNETAFEPLVSDTVLEKELESITEKV
jgi:hypothetical protein